MFLELTQENDLKICINMNYVQFFKPTNKTRNEEDDEFDRTILNLDDKDLNYVVVLEEFGVIKKMLGRSVRTELDDDYQAATEGP